MKDNYQLFLYMIEDRQERINKNTQEIQVLKKELQDDIPYHKCLEAKEKINNKRTMIERKLKELCEENKLNKIEISVAGDQIQMLADKVKEKEEIIRFLNMMLIEIQKHPHFYKGFMFRQYCKQNRQIAFEEFGENISVGKQLFQFIKLLNFTLKIERYQTKEGTTFQDRLSLILIYYQNCQHELIIEQEMKEDTLKNKRKRDIDNFQLRLKLQKADVKLGELLIQVTTYMNTINEERMKKQLTIKSFEQLNEKLQLQLNQLNEMCNMEFPKTVQMHPHYTKRKVG